jgi:NAD(P)-dependent dehydrogenase (short-subunit alcohol dehydrogenase family)
MSREVALIVGVGRATGQAMCRQWSHRYKLVLIARSKEVITALADELPDAHALPCDVANRDAWGATLRRILEEFGVPKRILINTEVAAWGEYNTLSLDQLDNSFDVNAISLLQLVQTLFPNKDEIPSGTRIMISSSPAAYHPPARFLGLAPSRVAQRVMAELLHENLARHGLAFSVLSINGAIDEPKMRAMNKDKPTSFFIQPNDIAKAMVRLFDSEDFMLAAEIRGESSFA